MCASLFGSVHRGIFFHFILYCIVICLFFSSSFLFRLFRWPSTSPLWGERELNYNQQTVHSVVIFCTFYSSMGGCMCVWLLKTNWPPWFDDRVLAYVKLTEFKSIRMLIQHDISALNAVTRIIDHFVLLQFSCVCSILLLFGLQLGHHNEWIIMQIFIVLSLGNTVYVYKCSSDFSIDQ